MDKLLEEIKLFFNDFVVSIKDLHDPTLIFVRDFCMRSLIELEVDDENVRKWQITQVGVDPDEIEILPELNLLTALKAAFPFNDFQLLEILLPKQERTCQHIRSILNFLSFADSRVSNLNPHMAAYQDKKESIETLKTQKNTASQELNDLALERNELIRSKKEIEDSRKEILKKLHDVRQNYNELCSKKNLAVEELKKKEMNVVAKKQELRMVDKEIDELKSELVEHAEIDENNLKEQENLLQKLKAKNEGEKNLIKEKKYQKDKMNAVLEAMNDRLVPTSTSIVEEIKKSRDYEQQLVNKEKEIKNLKSTQEVLLKKLKGMKEDLVNEERKKIKLIEEMQLEEADADKCIKCKESQYTDYLSKFKITKKYKKKFDDAKKRVEDKKKTAIESKNMFIEMKSLIENKENALEEVVDKFYKELKVEVTEFSDMKKKLKDLNRKL